MIWKLVYQTENSGFSEEGLECRNGRQGKFYL